jgi:hypothetical protein
MSPIILEHQLKNGELLQATFLPDRGMNMISYKKGDIEVIDQSTRSLFDERFAGLGALIGPHFHHRKEEVIPKIDHEERFPHIARLKAKGIKEPFSHGIARYAPWKVETTKNSFKGQLSGKDLWNEVSLASLEGQNFAMNFVGHLEETGLFLTLSVVSDTASLVGTHYYYHLPSGKGTVTSEVQNSLIKEGKEEPIPAEWGYDTIHHRLVFDLKEEADYNFHSHPDSLKGKIVLDAETYKLHVNYDCPCAENSWQLYHPKGASFVCIEPISARDPRHSNLTASTIRIHIDIEKVN